MQVCCGCSSMVEQKLPKLTTRVRFPSPAPRMIRRSDGPSVSFPKDALMTRAAAVSRRVPAPHPGPRVLACLALSYPHHDRRTGGRLPFARSRHRLDRPNCSAEGAVPLPASANRATGVAKRNSCPPAVSGLFPCATAAGAGCALQQIFRSSSAPGFYMKINGLSVHRADWTRLARFLLKFIRTLSTRMAGDDQPCQEET